MLIKQTRWLSIIGFLSVLLLASACFQQVGDEADINAVSERLSPTPSLTPTVTNTPAPTETELVQAEAVDMPASNQITPEGTLVAQTDGVIEPEPDSYSQQATEIVREATQAAIDAETATAIYLGLGATVTPMATATFDTFVPTSTQAFVSFGDCVHEVRQGETMYRLSMYYGLPVNQIAAANGVVNPSLIIVGDRFTIPGCGTTGAIPPATSTPQPTVALFGQGGATTDLSNLGQGGAITNTGVCGGQYIVEQYDTLFQISLLCGVPVQSIANANGITNINRINMGDILVIPFQ